MFTMRYDVIPPFTDGNNIILPRITGTGLMDNTILATLRALLFGRIGAEESLTVKRAEIDSTRFIGKTKNSSKKTVFESFIAFKDRNILNFLCLKGSNEDAETVISFFDKHFAVYGSSMGWQYQELKDVETYIRGKLELPVSIWVDEGTNRALIVINEMSLRVWHFMQTFTTRLLPGFFREKPKTETETALLKSLTERTSSTYMKLMEEIASREDIRSYMTHGLLVNFERDQRKLACDRAEEKRIRAAEQLSRINDSYIQAVRALNEATLRYEGAKALLESQEENNELFEYFSDNRSLELISAKEGTMEIIVRTFLDIYDPDLYARFARKGDIFKHYDDVHKEVFQSEENRKLLLDHIFSANPDLRIRMCAYYRLDLNDCACYSESARTYPDSCKDYLPNPHLNFHNCLGDYRPMINESLRNGNLIAALEQCIASAKSVNLAETSMTFRPMLEMLMNWRGKVLVNRDGEAMTPEEALAWIKQKGEATA